MYKVVPMGLALAVAAGCSSYEISYPESEPIQPFAAPPAGHATVCVFRASRLGAALTVLVRDNESVVGATEPQTYFCYLGTPGQHELTVEHSDAPSVTFRVRPGVVYLFEHHINFGQDELLQVDAARGRRLVAATEYAQLTEGPEGEPTPDAIPVARGR